MSAIRSRPFAGLPPFAKTFARGILVPAGADFKRGAPSLPQPLRRIPADQPGPHLPPVLSAGQVLVRVPAQLQDRLRVAAFVVTHHHLPAAGGNGADRAADP